MDQQLLRVKEAAQLLKVSKWTIYRWIDEGRLEATKIGGGSLRIFRLSVMALVDVNRTATSQGDSMEAAKVLRVGDGWSVKR